MCAPPTQTATHRPETPQLDAQEALRILERSYGLQGELSELPSHVDRNFLVHVNAGQRFVLKVSHADQPDVLLDLENEVFEIGRASCRERV